MQSIYTICGQKAIEFSSSPIWMLGRCYLPKQTPDATDDEDDCELIERDTASQFGEFLSDFYTRFHFTYRSGFSAIGDSLITSDFGWGCMLRSAQMLLGQAFQFHFLGRDWRIRMDTSNESIPDIYWEILRWFGDFPGAPYSLHNLSLAGVRQNKLIGDWLGPSSVAVALRSLVNRHKPDRFTIYVSDDGMVYKDHVERLCLDYSGEWKSVLIVVPIRLGLDRLNPVYIPSLKKMFTLPQSLGIAGGKPRSSLYFVAYQDDDVFYLDPHTVNEAVSMENKFFDRHTYHCSLPKRMPISELDPSMAVAFYCDTRDSFERFGEEITEMAQDIESCIFSFQKQSPTYSVWTEDETPEVDNSLDLSDIVIL